MILTVDIGNAAMIVCGMEDGKAVFTCRISSVSTRTADEYAILLSQAAQMHQVDPAQTTGAIIASVVPPLTAVVRDALQILTGVTPLVVGPGIKTGLNIRIDDPSELGADFVAASVAALRKYSLPCVTIDMSAATAMGILSEKGAYIGAIISPGVMMGLEALAGGTSKLSHVSLDAPATLIGKNSETSMRSGIVLGTASMIDGLIKRIEDQLGQSVTVVATGDYADKVIPYCTHTGIVIDDNLVMEGLWHIYKLNKSL
jgi:type III pantothenate kinase